MIRDAGFGKSTQIPQFLHETGLTKHGAIAVTQPRRIAAITIAKWVAEEMDCFLGDLVGYKARFENITSIKTKIKYMTDDSLLCEALIDTFLLDYSVIILDDAHERTISTDVLFSFVKKAQEIRDLMKFKPLKIIIISTPMDVDHFKTYFDNCPIISLEGNTTFPISFFHIKESSESSEERYLYNCLITFFQIHEKAPAK